MAVTSPEHTERMVAYQATEHGVVRRFRNPSKYDVLSGRGGSVNSHFGNVYFREIVQARKYEYNVESKKERKAEICREVMAQVTDKGGTFLVKENNESSGFWIEQSDDRTMAKVSQALREGAPKMRQAVGISDRTNRKRTPERHVISSRQNKTSSETTTTTTTTRSNNYNSSNNKRVRVEYKGKQVHPGEVTPPAKSTSSPSSASPTMPPLTLSSLDQNANSVSTLPPLPNPKTLERSFSSVSLTGILPDGHNCDYFFDDGFVDMFSLMLQQDRKPLSERSHSLSLTDISANPNYLQDDFVNPFENEEENYVSCFSRQTSNASDMGGLGSLIRNEAELQQRTPS